MIQDQKLSIIVPCYNSEKFLSFTLESLIAQSYKNFECILVDDGSSDRTIEIIEKYVEDDKRIKIFLRNSNRCKGPSSCRNIGLENAVGEYVIFLDSDDLLLNTCLEDRLNFALRYNNYDFWIFTTKMFLNDPGDNSPIFNQKISKKQSNLTSFLSGGFPYCIMGPLWRRQVLLELNGFDEHLIIFEDPDLHIRSYLRGYTSKTDERGIADNFYRSGCSKNRKISKQILNKRLISALLFFRKYDCEYHHLISKNASEFFKNFILPSRFISTSFKLYIIYVKRDYFSLKQIIFIPIAIVCNKLGLNLSRGLGYYSFQKFIFK